MKLWLQLIPGLLFSTVSAAGTCKRVPSCTTNTTSGLVVGVCDSDVNSFLAIPYAKPPINDLRFSAAEEYTGASLINATALPPFCPQSASVSQSEDCLYLNVYQPSSGSSNKPVMVWFHGGSFVEGGSADPTFDGSILAANQDVIVVTVNYRLGALGWLDTSLGTNFGLTDAVAALSWIQKNIGAFQGDKSSVTIFGESSGATLVRTLLMTPAASGMFARAIMQSDPMAYGLNNETAMASLSATFLSRLGCSDDDTTCLLSASIDDVLSAQSYINANAAYLPAVNPTYPWGPNEDNYVVAGDYAATLASGSSPVNNVDAIMGFVNAELGPSISATFPTPISNWIMQKALEAQFGATAGDLIYNTTDLFRTKMTTNSSDCGQREQLISIGTEWGFSCPIQYNAGNAAGTGANIYVYEFNEGILYRDNAGLALCGDENVCHEDDLYCVFGTYSSADTAQIALATDVQNRWAAFARSGSPNYSGGANWSSVESLSNLNVFSFGNSAVSSYVDEAQCDFFGNKVLYQWQTSF